MSKLNIIFFYTTLSVTVSGVLEESWDMVKTVKYTQKVRLLLANEFFECV